MNAYLGMTAAPARHQAVTLLPLGDGTYAVHRHGTDTGARVVNGHRDWFVHHRGIGVAGAAGWSRSSEVVAWLESEPGEKWLNSLREDR